MRFLFCYRRKSATEYTKCPIARRSVRGLSTYLMGGLISAKKVMQKVVVLSVTEAELMAGVQHVQGMLYIMRILESIGLKVKKAMVLYIGNKRAVDLANNWSIGRRTRHIETRQHCLYDLKEEDVLKIVWIP